MLAYFIVCIGVSTPPPPPTAPNPLKNNTLYFLPSLLNQQTMQADQLFLSVNISDFNLFLCENSNTLPLKNFTPVFQQPPPKVEVLPRSPFVKMWLGAQSPPLQKEEGCTLFILMFGLCI